MRFHTTLPTGTKVGIEIPPEVIEALGAGKKPPVRVTLNGFTYRSTVAVMGGRFMVGVSAENRKGAGVAPGDAVDVDIELDTEPRVVVLPADLEAALGAKAGALAAYEAQPVSARKEVVRQVEEAKSQETRDRRIAAIVARLG